MIFGCPRTATVVALNYITCATLTRAKYLELIYLYPKFQFYADHYINYKYIDPLKLFLELKLNRLKFFKNLPMNVKNEFIFNMKIESKAKGEYIYTKGENC